MDTSNPSADFSEILRVKITDLSRGGAGVARDDSGRVIFVPRTMPGDFAAVRIAATKKRFAQGELVEILEPSSDRQKPPCAVFGQCGGCQWQHVPYPIQWRTKLEGVMQALGRAGVEKTPDFSEFPAEKIWEYRNRIQLRGLGQELGFFAAASHDRVPANRCEIARPELNAAWEETRKQGAALKQPFKVELEVSETGEVLRSWNARHGFAGFRQVNDEQNEKLRQWIAGALTPGRELFDLFGGSGNLSLPLASKMKMIHCVDVSVPESESRQGFYRSPVRRWLIERAKGRTVSAIGSSAILDPPPAGTGG